MEEQLLDFNVTPEGIELLAQILDAASASAVPEHDWESGPADLSDSDQDFIFTLMGAISVQLLQQLAEAEDDD